MERLNCNCGSCDVKQAARRLASINRNIVKLLEFYRKERISCGNHIAVVLSLMKDDIEHATGHRLHSIHVDDTWSYIVPDEQIRVHIVFEDPHTTTDYTTVLKEIKYDLKRILIPLLDIPEEIFDNLFVVTFRGVGENVG